MYYVIQRLHGIKNKSFVSYSVPKYISSQKNSNVIFEFGEKPNVKRKWAPKDEIVLLTQDKLFFVNYLKKLKEKETSFLKKIDAQKKRLDALYQELNESMHQEFDSIKNSKESPSLL